MTRLLFICFIFCSPAWAKALSCQDLWATTEARAVLRAPYSSIFAGQRVVGKDYAIYKEMRSADLKPKFKLDDLSPTKRQKLLDAVLKDLETPLPAVRDPSGRIFLLDGHHGIYVATLLHPRIADLVIPVQLMFDATMTSMSHEDFVHLALSQHWFYETTALESLTSPLKVHELQDSPERSIMGMLFLYIEDTFDVPMKGKYFSPFVQFYLVDLIKEKQLYVFPTEFDSEHVPQLQKRLFRKKEVLQFWLDHLRSKAPNKLRSFLENAP